MRRFFLFSIVAIIALMARPSLAADRVMMFAAASLKSALDPLAAAYAAGSGNQVAISYASSATLAKQIEQGAPADLFASADRDWMDYLQARQLIVAATRVDLLGNSLVAIVPRASAMQALAFSRAAFAAAAGEGRIATGDVNSVPLGLYAKAALMQLGLWEQVKDHLAPADNARVALQLVARGEVPLGIVYATDARAEAGVRVVAIFPAESHPAIVYPFALVAGGKNAAARNFLDFLESAAARPFFEAQGFVLLAAD